MLEEKATIIRIENNQTSWVEVNSKPACNGCQAKSGCATSIVGQLFKQKPRFFRVTNTINAKQGEQVIIGIHEKTMLKAALIGYILPLLSLFLFSLLGIQFAEFMSLKNTDFSAIIFAGFGLYFGIKLASYQILKAKKEKAYQAIILRKDLFGNLS